nr:Sir2 family NAD-dependent protein deacetylase [Cupriavidus pauculus]
MMGLPKEARLAVAAEWIAQADGLLVTAGAGMGVDSGLPDFRGKDGFWRAYPAFRQRRIEFHQLASPKAMRALPELAWGFYGHRLNMYRATQPHAGFHILRRWAEAKSHGLFVFTSNVDGHFQMAGVSDVRIMECHGSIHYLQCFDGCTPDIWPAGGFDPQVDEGTCRLTSPIPRCPGCGAMVRPNILMFNDSEWIEDRTDRQRQRLDAWLVGVSNLAVIELGAGKMISTVRRFSERHRPHVIRINPRDFKIAPNVGIGIAGGALETLSAIDTVLGS